MLLHGDAPLWKSNGNRSECSSAEVMCKMSRKNNFNFVKNRRSSAMFQGGNTYREEVDVGNVLLIRMIRRHDDQVRSSEWFMCRDKA